MDLRRYELVTLAAARAVGSDYCAIAHALVLRDGFYSEDELRAIAVDHHAAGLDEVDVAVMDFAARVAADPTGRPDPAPLRAHGLSDVEVLQSSWRPAPAGSSAVCCLPSARCRTPRTTRCSTRTCGRRSPGRLPHK